ncbi:hypothetical protein CKA38_01240 [Ereboglobus luteus]|uniref:UGSC-like domain-containing protein n=2 Tax=Ereboglobus luteus TaxID=1796921 RepID=A0A2U8E0G4_9BACT|nr:hypothetical protein CKA38_01240 [Ereboglobus luteus]
MAAIAFAQTPATPGLAGGSWLKPANVAECVDDACAVPPVSITGEQAYGVVAPIGNHDVKMIQQAPRLDTLDGKTIALVGGSFNASVTHQEIKRLILKNYPKAKVLMFQEVGAAGQYYERSRQVKEFQSRLKELNVDAVISGNAGCGICTLKETGNCIAAEHIGIPAVTVGAPTFVRQIYSTGINRGVPAPRAATYPGAFSAHTNEELVKNTREIVWPQIVSALTEPISDGEIAERAHARMGEPREIVFTGTQDEVSAFFADNRWSDGLPIIPPTIERVEEFLKFTDHAWDSVIGTIPPANRKALVWHVAVNGVMAGCPPEYMPLLIAYTKALGVGNFRRPLASTHAWTPYGWINGPVSRQLGIDCGQGMISEPRNMLLGRFINLAMLNLGGYYVKENRMGTFGYLTPWSFTEDEEACLRIGWEPYHVQKGYDLNQNALTAGSALMWGNNLTPATPDAEKIMELIAWDIVEGKSQNALGATNPTVYRTIFVTEFVARDLAKKYETKTSLETALVKTARRPAHMRAYANYWANPGSQQSERFTFEQYKQRIIRRENAELTEPPPWFPPQVAGGKKIHTVATMEPGMTPILVTGDRDRNKVQVMPGGAYATILIELPSNWDALMEARGYRPLKEFFLTEDSAGAKPSAKNSHAVNPPEKRPKKTPARSSSEKVGGSRMRAKSNHTP